MKLIRAMALLILRHSLAPTWSPSPTKLVDSLCALQAPFFHQGCQRAWGRLRALHFSVEECCLMVVRLTDQRSLHFVLLGQLVMHPQQILSLTTAQEIIHVDHDDPSPVSCG